MTVYVVITRLDGEILDLEVMDEVPTFGPDSPGFAGRFPVEAAGRLGLDVFVANVNGGDSLPMKWGGWHT